MKELLAVLFSAQSKKAFTAGGATLLGSLGTAMLDGSLTGSEVMLALGAGLVATAGVFKVKNEPA